MPYNRVATNVLQERADNLVDYQNASPGQWFIGVVDTHNRNVYILPIDPQSEGATGNNQPRSMNRYASGVLATTPNDPKDTGGVVNVHQTTVWTSAPANWLSTTGGNTTHERLQVFYHLDADNLLGFTLIKMSDGIGQGGFAMLKCSSNTMNNRAGAGRDLKDCGIPALVSFSRGTFENKGPGIYPPGTTQMPENWSDALLTYFRQNPFNIAHCIKSNE